MKTSRIYGVEIRYADGLNMMEVLRFAKSKLDTTSMRPKSITIVKNGKFFKVEGLSEPVEFSLPASKMLTERAATVEYLNEKERDKKPGAGEVSEKTRNQCRADTAKRVSEQRLIENSNRIPPMIFRK